MAAANDPEYEGAAWGAICHRGELTLEVATLEYARSKAWDVHADARFVMVVHADDGQVTRIGAVSLASVRHFVADMLPRSVALLYARGEASPDELLGLVDGSSRIH